MKDKPVTVTDFKRMKRDGIPITALTAYDSIFAALLDQAGIDLILVGDSLANVFQGRTTTIPVTIEEMMYHAEIVARNVKHAFVAVDMPFMSFQINPEDALKNAGNMIKKTGCKAVKLEGGIPIKSTIKKIVDTGIPVLAHLGLTPQSIHVFGGYGVRGRDNHQSLIDEAKAIEEAGAFAVVLEKIPRNLAAEITSTISIPTIGIGAGNKCDGQILVTPDMLGLNPEFNPKFVRRYADLAERALEGFKLYCANVRSRNFPSEDESYE
ncbi:MAG: 3-methyl-2-oxobutanoate hydroxymethyltransferase [Candidatus Latescibacteria bacterium]|nr:3-methyl-2-oxobutanoate hydroxymethyltransferase [Candidatus Latescibacterota bacterium]